MRRTTRIPQALAASTAILALAVGLGTTGAGAAVPAPECVGVCAAASPGTADIPAADHPFELVIGRDVVRGKHIVTGPSDQLVVRFLDRSSLTLGPNSDVVIDEFVFDRNTGAGKLTLNAARGALRYAGGKISTTADAVSIHTGVGTVGVHGGVFLLALAPNGEMDVVSLDGDGPTVSGGSGTPQTLSRPVSIVTIAGPGAAASSPVPLSAESWALLTQAAAVAAPSRSVAAAH